VRRNFFDLSDNAAKAPSYFSVYNMIQMMQPGVADLNNGILNADNENLLENMKQFMQNYVYWRDSQEIIYIRKAIDEMQNTLYPSKSSFTYHALFHGGWAHAELDY
jgi:hypothetical protein